MGDDNDLSETFKAYSADRRDKRWRNFTHSLELLRSFDIAHVVKDQNTAHVIVMNRFDFWPTTGLWKDRGTSVQGRGVKNLLLHLKAHHGVKFE